MKEPLLTRAGIVTAISVLAALLVHLGAGSVSDWLAAHSDQIAGVLLAVGPLVTGLLARAHVTPVASPKDNAGNRLVPATQQLDVSAALAAADAIYPGPAAPVDPPAPAAP